jgi:hypothetical protein
MYDGATANMGLSTDPFTGGSYAFGNGNPVSNIEQDGHMVCAEDGPCGSIQALEAYYSPSHQLNQVSSSFQNDIGTINQDIGTINQGRENNSVGSFMNVPALEQEQNTFKGEAKNYLQQLNSVNSESGITSVQRAEIGELEGAIKAEEGALSTFNGSAAVNNNDYSSLDAAADETSTVGAGATLINDAVQAGGYVGGESSGSGDTLTFYHGTSFYAANEAVEKQAFQVDGILARQSSAGTQATGSIFLSTQQSTADYFSNAMYGSGAAGGPSTLRVVVNKSQFMSFAAQNGIAFETPVDRLPGMTETKIPIGAAGEFNDMGIFSLVEEGE